MGSQLVGCCTAEPSYKRKINETNLAPSLFANNNNGNMFPDFDYEY